MVLTHNQSKLTAMKKMLPALLMAVALISTYSANAQMTDTVKTDGWFHHHHQFTGTAQIQVTYRKTDLGQLNGILTGNGLAPLGENDIWINASMNHSFGKWIWEDGLGFTPVTTSDENDIKAKYNQYQIYGRLGYNVLSNADMRLFPFAGVNFSAAVLDIEDKAGIESTSNFSDEIRNSSYSKTFYQPNFGIDLGVGFDYLIPVKPKDMGCFLVQRQVPVGIRAGYYINAYKGDWRIDDNYKLYDGPDQKQSAVFISLNIGLGFEVKK
jgi:hypothetical protein